MLLDDSMKQVRPIKMAEMRRPTFGMQFTELAVTQSRNDGIGEFFQLSVLTVRRDKRQRMSSILTETVNVHDAHALHTHTCEYLKPASISIFLCLLLARITQKTDRMTTTVAMSNETARWGNDAYTLCSSTQLKDEEKTRFMRTRELRGSQAAGSHNLVLKF